MNEKALIKKCQRGEQQAFDRLIRLYYDYVFGFLSAASVFGFFFAVLLFSPLLQFSALTAGGALLLAFIAVPSAFLSFLIKIPKQVKYPLPVGR